MKKMIKGFAIVALLSAFVVLTGCGNKSKYESIENEGKDAVIELLEIHLDYVIEKSLKKFENLTESEQKKEIEKEEEGLEVLKKEVKKAKKNPEEAKYLLREIINEITK